MTQPLSWTLHGNDRLSEVLEKLDRNLDKLARSMDQVGNHARQMGRSVAQAEGPTNRLASSADHASGRLGGLGSKLASVGSAAAQMGAAVAAAAALATASLVGIGVATASANEQAAISFELLLGNADKAKTFLADLQKFSAATPFEMPQLRTAASRLLAVGVESKRIIPLLTALGDATAGMGTGAEGIERAVTALTQMSMKTKVSAEEMLQLTEAGIPAWQALAAILRVDVATAMKMVERREVDASKAFEAIERKAGPAMQRLSGMMDRQSTTLAGVWSTFKDNASQALAKFFEPMLPALKKLLDILATQLPQALEKVRAFFADPEVSAWLAKLKEDLAAVGEVLLQAVGGSFKFFVDSVMDNKETVSHAIISLVTALGLLASALLLIGGAAVRVAGFMHESFKVAVNAVLGYISIFVNAAAAAFGWVPGIGTELKKAARDFEAFRDRVNDALSGIRDRTVRVNVTGSGVRYTQGGSGVEIPFGGGFQERASGGPVWPGQVYRWQEQGFEGLMLNGASGRVISNQDMRSAGGGYDDRPFRLEVVVKGEDGSVLRTKLLEFKHQRGFRELGLA